MSGLVVKSYLEDAMSMAPSMGGCQPDASVRGRPKAGGLTEFSGSYAPTECQLGMLGGSEYYRAYRESELARMAPDVLGRSVKSSWDDGFISLITPDKPAPVSLAGYDVRGKNHHSKNLIIHLHFYDVQVFGPQSFTTTTRNMILDLRGEAAYAPNLSGDIPVGASVSSLAMGAAMNYSDCEQGCGCLANPAGIQLPGSMRVNAYPETVQGRQNKCADSCSRTSKNIQERATCLRGCAQDVPLGNRLAMAGSNEDLEQDCFTSCVASGNGASQKDCVTACRGMFGNSSGGRGGSVSNVHAEFFTPKQLHQATVLRPYQS
jgi:hypothetical protein